MWSLWKPIGLFGLQMVVMSAILGFTKPNSFLRPSALAIVVLCPYMQFPSLEYIAHPILRAFLGAASMYAVVLYTDTALIHKWSFEARGPTSDAGGLNPVATENTESCATGLAGERGTMRRFYSRLGFGLGVTFQSRFPATKWPVKNIPPFSRANAKFVPRKMVFIRTELVKLTACVSFLFLLDCLPSDPEAGRTLFSSQRIALFSRATSVSTPEAAVRIASVLAYWTSQYVTIQAVYSTLAMVAVALGITSVESWPPVFGSINESHSIRKFWGSFYHQLLRRGCSGVAHFFSCTCLGLRKETILGRYVYIAAVFAVSGIFHAFSDLTQGIPWQESGALQFFTMQAAGIMFEDALEALLCSSPLHGKNSNQFHSSGAKILLKALGYLWTGSWLVWSTPVWIYPSLGRSDGAAIIPFSSDLVNGLFHFLLVRVRDYVSQVTILSVLKAVCFLEGQVMVLSSFAAVLGPTSFARQFGLPFFAVSSETRTIKKGSTTLGEEVDARHGKKEHEVGTWQAGWVIFSARELALGLTIILLVCFDEVKSLALLEISMNAVAIGDSYAVFRYGEEASTKKHFIPLIAMLFMGPALLLVTPVNST